MKLKNFAIKVVAALTMAISLASCAGSGPGEHDHVWDGGTVTTEATCHSKGVRTFKCTVEGCGQTKTENIAMTAHNWGDGKVTKEPTCSVPGIRTFTCQNEGCNETKTEAIPTIDHHYAPGDITKVPDLLEKGERQLVCNVCGDIKKEALPERADYSEQFGLEDSDWMFGYLDSFVAPTEESEDEFDIQPHELELSEGSYKHGDVEFKKNSVSVGATECAFLGYLVPEDTHKLELNFTISFKGKEDNTRVNAYMVLYAETGAIYANEISENAKDWTFAPEEALDVEEENLGGAYLSVIFKNAGEGAAEGELSGCFTAKCVHTWDEGQVTKAPTETAEGVRTYTCIKCEETYDEAIEKLPEHDAIKFVQDVNYFPRFDNKDDEGGTIDFVGNAWLTNDGYTVHSEVTEKHEEDAWRGGVFLDTGVKLVKGHTIELTFKSSVKEELGEDENFGLILQPKQWSKVSDRIEYLTSPLGDQSITVDIKEDYKDGENDATLWIALEMGTIENEVVIANVKAVDIGETPVDPHPERFDFTDKIDNRCDTADGTIDVACTSTVSDFGHKATLDVTSACDHIWRAGMFVNTGYALEAGKTYTVKFNLERAEDEDYEVILQNAQWKTDEQTEDDIRVAFLGKVVGEISEEIIITEANKGSLWIYIQSGTAVNTISISDLVVKSEVTPDDPLKDYFDFKNKTHDRFDGAQGRTWLTDSNHTLNLEITTVGAEDWRGGVFVETGLTTEAGKSYEVSFEVSRPDSEKRNDFSIRFINKQWEEKEYAKLETPDGAVSKIFTVTNENAGSLWIYVQSGNQLNKISVTKLTAKEVTAHTVTITDTDHTLTEIVQEGREYTLPTWEHAAPEHHSFDHYDLAGVAKNPGDKILVNADKAISVVWKEDTKYTVSFDANGGTGSIQSVSVYAGDFTLPDYTGLVAPDGKHFKGWNIDDDTTLRIKGYVHNVTKDTVVKAIWEQNPVTKYTVTYKAGEDATGEDVVVSDQFGEYTLINVPNTFTAPTGKLFKCWSVNSEEKAPGATIDLDTLHNVTVTAIWDTAYTVSFKGNGAEGSMDSVTKLTGSKYQLPDNGFTVPTGKFFGGWLVGDDTTVCAVGYEITVAGNVEIKAVWGDIQLTNDNVAARIDSPAVEGSIAFVGEGYGIAINITDEDTEIYKGGATIHLTGIGAVGSYTLTFTGALTDRTATYEVLVGDTQFNKEYGAGYGLGDGNHSITFYAYRTGDYWLTIQCGNATGTVTLTNFKVVNNSNAYMLLNDRVSPRFDANDGRTGLAGTATVVNDGYGANINVQTLPTDSTKIARWAGGAIVKLADSIAPGTYTLSFSSYTTIEDTREFELLIGYRACEKDYFSYNGIKNGDHEFTFYAYNRAELYLCFACGDTTGELVVSNFKLTKNSNYLKVAYVEARIDTGGDGEHSRAGLAGSANLDHDDYGVTSTISHLPDLENVRERWAGGAIIKLTNSNVTTGKYQLRFISNSEQGDDHKYEIGVSYRSYNNDYAVQYNLSNGEHFFEFNATQENEPVWLCLGCGDTLGTISFTDFTLVRVGNLS